MKEGAKNAGAEVNALDQTYKKQINEILTFAKLQK